MKVQNKNIRSRQGFTLVEMLGVLAIIAILISVIAVGVLSAINRSRIVATTATLKNVETGVTGYIALPNSGGTMPVTEGAQVVTTGTVAADGTTPAFLAVGDATKVDIDQVLTSAGFLEKPISWRVGTDGSAVVAGAAQPTYSLSKRAFLVTNIATAPDLTAYNRVESAALVSATIPALADVATSAAFAAKPQFAIDGQTPLAASRVVYVVFPGVSLKDAQKLSQELNGALDNSEFAAAGDGQLKGRFIYGAAAANNTVTAFYYIASF